MTKAYGIPDGHRTARSKWSPSRTFICASTSRICAGSARASIVLIVSSAVEPGGMGTPDGRCWRNAFGFVLRSRSRSRSWRSRHWARVSPPSTSSPRTVVLPSKNGSESARSMRSGRPPRSCPFRFRTADSAVSWSAGKGERGIKFIPGGVQSKSFVNARRRGTQSSVPCRSKAKGQKRIQGRCIEEQHNRVDVGERHCDTQGSTLVRRDTQARE